MQNPLNKRIGYALVVTAAGAAFFALFGEIQSFPGGFFGFGAFLLIIFILSILLFQKIDL